MNKPNYTPGPWKAINYWIGTLGEQTIGYASDHRNDRPTPLEEQKANALIMSKAPEMLELLQDNFKTLCAFMDYTSETLWEQCYDPKANYDRMRELFQELGILQNQGD